MDREETGPEKLGKANVILVGSSSEQSPLITAVNREDSTETDPEDVGRAPVGQIGSNKGFVLNTAVNRRFQ